jgi:hypothetical protein
MLLLESLQNESAQLRTVAFKASAGNGITMWGVFARKHLRAGMHEEVHALAHEYSHAATYIAHSFSQAWI